MKKLVIFGGNGYLGQHVIRNAVNYGLNITSINRSGKTSSFDTKFVENSNSSIKWHLGNILKEDDWKDDLKGADAVISFVGMFASNESMERVNGDGNINAIRVAKEQNVPRFVYISSVENNLPILHGYFHGKKRAEDYLQNTYDPNQLSILRPSFIYGTRKVKGVPIPLWMMGKPLESLFSRSLFSLLRKTLPGMKAVLAPPVSVDDVANTVLVGALGPEFFNLPIDHGIYNGVLNFEDIKRIGKLMKRA